MTNDNELEDRRLSLEETMGTPSEDDAPQAEQAEQAEQADEEERAAKEENEAVGGTVLEMAQDAAEKDIGIKDDGMTNLNVYLFNSIAEETELTRDQIALEFRREHGEKLDKNKHFFNAVFATIDKDAIREELNLPTEGR